MCTGDFLGTDLVQRFFVENGTTSSWSFSARQFGQSANDSRNLRCATKINNTNLSQLCTQHQRTAKNKSEYYRLLQDVRDSGNWESWVLFTLKGIEETAVQTIKLVEQMRAMMADCKRRLRIDLPKLYSQDLLNNLFRHPYTKIDFVEQELRVTRQTASKYLNQLAGHGYLRLLKIGRSNFYLNDPLFNLFINAYQNIPSDVSAPLLESIWVKNP